jgi:hypothetical protein
MSKKAASICKSFKVLLAWRNLLGPRFRGLGGQREGEPKDFDDGDEAEADAEAKEAADGGEELDPGLPLESILPKQFPP